MIRALPAAARESLIAQGSFGDHEQGDQIYHTGDAIAKFVFPLSGIVSLTLDTKEGQTVEVAVTGNEGMVGVGRFVGRENSDTNAVVQISGELLTLPIGPVLEAAEAIPAFRAAIDRLVASLMVETAQSAVCNQVHSVEQRTARWLLHAADRAGTTDLRLTHEFLAQMLAVRRPSVTDVVGIFNRAKLTTASRGLISIMDRDGLTKLTCECYEVVRAATPR